VAGDLWNFLQALSGITGFESVFRFEASIGVLHIKVPFFLQSLSDEEKPANRTAKHKITKMNERENLLIKDYFKCRFLDLSTRGSVLI
jgi:hypothetical protein